MKIIKDILSIPRKQLLFYYKYGATIPDDSLWSRREVLLLWSYLISLKYPRYFWTTFVYNNFRS